MAFYLACLTVLAVVELTLSAEGSAKPGCPTANKDKICVWYNDQCKNDDANCAEGEICCGDTCGTFCTKPALATKPGKCPPNPPGSVGTCAEFCTGDDSCPGNKKCCSNGCGHECKTPIGIGKSAIRKKRSFPTCEFGRPLSNIFCGRGPTRQNCPEGTYCNVSPVDAYAVCCPRAPATKPGICPAPNPPGSVGTCADLCTDDDSCLGNKKCCSNGCGHECKTPIGIGKSAIRKKQSFPTCEFGLPLPNIFCGRGPTRQDCPPGTFCNVSPVDAYAVCCPIA